MSYPGRRPGGYQIKQGNSILHSEGCSPFTATVKDLNYPYQFRCKDLLSSWLLPILTADHEYWVLDANRGFSKTEHPADFSFALQVWKHLMISFNVNYLYDTKVIFLLPGLYRCQVA